MKKEFKESIILSGDTDFNLPDNLGKLIYFLQKLESKHKNVKANLKFKFSVEHDGLDYLCVFRFVKEELESDKEFKTRVEASNKNITEENNQLLKDYLDAKKLYSKVPGITVNKPRMKKLHKIK